mmetsp:Transcript_77266/g.185058  ORF Transcript_77266/g.185058 Transcript_77266/m.185058 type:complete len:220 (+) Transcript_77266:785-1444(+)
MVSGKLKLWLSRLTSDSALRCSRPAFLAPRSTGRPARSASRTQAGFVRLAEWLPEREPESFVPDNVVLLLSGRREDEEDPRRPRSDDRSSMLLASLDTNLLQYASFFWDRSCGTGAKAPIWRQSVSVRTSKWRKKLMRFRIRSKVSLLRTEYPACARSSLMLLRMTARKSSQTLVMPTAFSFSITLPTLLWPFFLGKDHSGRTAFRNCRSSLCPSREKE